MLNNDERAAWEDAFNQAQRTRPQPSDGEPGWYGTAGLVAAGLLAIWAMYAWWPPS